MVEAREEPILIPEHGKQLLDSILNELDGQAERQSSSAAGGKTDARRCRRQPFRVNCRIRFISPDKHEILEIAGRTRNLSRCGFSFVSRRLFTVPEPVELEVRLTGRPTTYITGMVRFCRYVTNGFHETGAEMKIMANRSNLAEQAPGASIAQVEIV